MPLDIDKGMRPAAASVHEALERRGALPPTIKPLHPRMRVWGPAFPVRMPRGTNLLAHWAVCEAAAGDVLVIDAGGGSYGHWGDILSAAARHRGIAGLVIDGGVRDSENLAGGELPVFATCVSMVGTTKELRADSALGTTITLGGVPVNRGDLVVGDADGVVVVPEHEAGMVIALALQREAAEAAYLERLAAGETTVDIYGLPQPGRAERTVR